METLLKLKIKESGIKLSFLAKKINVSPNYFYMCMKGTRELSQDKQSMLKQILK